MSSSLSDIFQFKLPIPSTLLQKSTTPANYTESNSQISRIGLGGFNPFGSSSNNSIWGGSTESRNNGRRILQNGSRVEMPPPQRPGQSRRPPNFVANESIQPNIPRLMFHSTPLHHPVPSARPKSLLRPLADSSVAGSNWSGFGSSYRGPESVRSIATNNNEFVDKLFQKALNKYLNKRGLNPEFEDLAIQVANELKNCAQEVASEFAEEGSVVSHYSKYSATWRSGTSIISDKGHDTLQSLFKSRQVAPRVRRDISPAKSVQCSIERSSCKKRTRHSLIPEEPTESQVVPTISFVEKTIQPSKRSLSPDLNESTDKECEPQTVRRKLNQGQDDEVPTTTVQDFGSPTSTVANTESRIGRRVGKNKPTLVDALNDRVGILTNDDSDDDDETPVKRKPKATGKKKGAEKKVKKTAAKKDANCTSISIAAVAILAVSCTRSGRNVKKTNFYQASTSTKKKRDPVDKTTDKSKIDENPSEKETKEIKEPKKQVVRKPKAVPQVPIEPEETAPKILTKRGRVVKPTLIYGAIKTLTPSPAPIKRGRPRANPAKEPVTIEKEPTKTKKGKSPKVAKISSTKPQSNDDDDDSDLSMNGLDMFIPEVTQSTRRGVVKSKYLTERALGAQTPPLMQITANLRSEIIASASNTGRSTPDWMLSQRTESEAKELQKRKTRLKKKKVSTKPPIKESRKSKNSKNTSRLLKLAQKATSTELDESHSESHESDESDWE